MSALDTALVTIGGLVLILGLISGWIRHTMLSEPLIALTVGVLLRSLAVDPLAVAGSGTQEIILREAARLTLAIGLMGVALRLHVNDLRRHWRALAALLGLVMPLMWLSSGLLVYLILGLPFLTALLIGAIITPTDPIVSSTIVTGSVADRYLPDHIKKLISAESGINDGLAMPLVVLPLLLLERTMGQALPHWFAVTILWEVGGAVVFGLLLGHAAGWFLEWGEAKHTIEQTSFLAYSLGLSLFVLGATKLLGVNDILAVFMAGIAFSRDVTRGERGQEERVQEAVNRFFTLPIFVLIGLALPWEGWLRLGWSGPLLVFAVLLLRRLPAVLLLRATLGQARGTADALFVGWFGPIGIAALYYANLAWHRVGLEEAWVTGSLVICASIVTHGLTATPFIRLYGGYAGKH